MAKEEVEGGVGGKVEVSGERGVQGGGAKQRAPRQGVEGGSRRALVAQLATPPPPPQKNTHWRAPAVFETATTTT